LVVIIHRTHVKIRNSVPSDILSEGVEVEASSPNIVLGSHFFHKIFPRMHDIALDIDFLCDPEFQGNVYGN